jgi:hypothetical protein
MHTSKTLLVAWALGALRLAAQQPPATALNQVVDKILSREQAEMESLRQYSPLVETYIQNLRPDKDLGTVPNGDKYFLSRAELGKTAKLEPFTDVSSAGMREFLQMIYIDTNGFDRQHYKFDYVRREFLGEVRCLVFDVTPQERAGKGRFVGRLWAEDRDYHIVRFNGAFTGLSKTNHYFHFDSWRVNAGINEWLPAFIYSEQGDVHNAITEKLTFKAQTRLWGYNLGQVHQEQELSKILVESSTPIDDQTTGSHDLSPLQARRSWDRQAEANVTDRMERLGLLAPPGEVDKVLETVVNNLEVTNDLNIEPEIRCRLLTTSTLESFTIGHTIVLSRGLVDVLPDEATLAAILATELGHVVLGHRIDAQYAFFDRLLFDDKETFRHFGFSRTPEEEQTAHQKAIDLLKNSPYKDQLATAQLFVRALQNRSQEIPNLISPHLGDRVLTDWTISSSTASLQTPDGKAERTLIVALPLGGRVKLDPWSDELQMIKTQPVVSVEEREKMPFEVTPFLPYLTRQGEIRPARSQTAGAIAPAPRER